EYRYSSLNERVRFAVCFLGVFICYFYYGILQETITRGDYSQGEKKEKFRYATTLVLIQCIISSVFARISDLVAGAGSWILIYSHLSSLVQNCDLCLSWESTKQI
uniref:Solute carrier family 35 member B1 n=1 Tax=Astyanax mexicanus TaxID=7994 RepID=A0A8B9HUQ5_ASTMX